MALAVALELVFSATGQWCYRSNAAGVKMENVWREKPAKSTHTSAHRLNIIVLTIYIYFA